MSLWLLLLLTLAELVLLVVVVVFYFRLKRSESLLKLLQQRHEELEQELVASFEDRQRELGKLEGRLGERAEELRELIERAEKLARKPESKRQTVLDGRKRGMSVSSLAQTTGLSVDEVELMLLEGGRT